MAYKSTVEDKGCDKVVRDGGGEALDYAGQSTNESNNQPINMYNIVAWTENPERSAHSLAHTYKHRYQGNNSALSIGYNCQGCLSESKRISEKRAALPPFQDGVLESCSLES